MGWGAVADNSGKRDLTGGQREQSAATAESPLLTHPEQIRRRKGTFMQLCGGQRIEDASCVLLRVEGEAVEALDEVVQLNAHPSLTSRGWSFPSWTSFGRVLATCEGTPCPRRPAIYSIDPFDRSDKRRIGGTYEGDHPAGHPRRSRLAYVATRRDQRDIFFKPLRHCCARRLTDTVAVESFPDWAPGGRWIVFVRQPKGRPDAAHDLFVVHVASGKTRRLTRTAADEMLPRFSPDGRFIVFSKSWGEEEGFVYRMRRDGTHLRKVTRRSGDHGPSWQPIPR